MPEPRIVAVGDSVMWGQGLAVARPAGVVKFADNVARALDTQSQILAHSGAVIEAKPGERRIVFPADVSPTGRGEIPSSFPTVHEQLAAIAQPHAVDLLLINGGANDWGFVGNLANPFVKLKKMDENIRDVFAERPKALIRRARAVCTNAVIAYTGYYQGISRETPTKHIKHMILFQVGGRAVQAGGVAGGSVTIATHFFLWTTLQQQLLRKTYHWAHQQLHWLRSAVAECNADPELRGPGILFVHPRFGVKNALGAKGGESWVFSLVDKFAPDDQLGLRTRECRKVTRQISVTRPMCKAAATFHPNPKGAREGYAARILFELKRTGFTDGLRVRPIIQELSPAQKSLRRGLRRYGLLNADAGSISLRDMNQHLQVDLMEVGVNVTERKSVPVGTGGQLDVGLVFGVSSTFFWNLTEFQGRAHVADPSDFFKAPYHYRFYIDPNLGDESGIRRQALRLSHVRTLLLKKVGSSVNLKIGGLSVKINGRHTVYTTGRTGINKLLTKRQDSWSAGQAGAAPYPAPE